MKKNKEETDSMKSKQRWREKEKRTLPEEVVWEWEKGSCEILGEVKIREGGGESGNV
jgi:hypothetical protein